MASEAQRADRINSSADITEGEVAEGFCSCCSANIDISGCVAAEPLGRCGSAAVVAVVAGSSAKEERSCRNCPLGAKRQD